MTDDRNIPTDVLDKLLVDANFRCCICRIDIRHKHHIEYFRKGGKNTENNLIIVCPNCHASIHQQPHVYTKKRLKMVKKKWIELCSMPFLSMEERIKEAPSIDEKNIETSSLEIDVHPSGGKTREPILFTLYIDLSIENTGNKPITGGILGIVFPSDFDMQIANRYGSEFQERYQGRLGKKFRDIFNDNKIRVMKLGTSPSPIEIIPDDLKEIRFTLDMTQLKKEENEVELSLGIYFQTQNFLKCFSLNIDIRNKYFTYCHPKPGPIYNFQEGKNYFLKPYNGKCIDIGYQIREIEKDEMTRESADTLARTVTEWVKIRKGLMDLRGVKFKDLDFSERDLSGWNLSNLYLKGGNFYRTKLDDAKLINCNLRDVDFGEASMKGADLTDSTLRNATLFRSNLEGAKLVNISLRDANLVEANLKNADLTDSNLKGVDIHKTNFEGVDFTGVQYERGSYIGNIIEEKGGFADPKINITDIEKENLDDLEPPKTFTDSNPELMEIYLIHHSGLLMDHKAPGRRSGIDKDILSSMLTAVTSFLEDSWKRGGQTTGFTTENYTIIIEKNEIVGIALVIKGNEIRGMREEITSCISKINKTFENILSTWSGDMGVLNGIKDIIDDLDEKIKDMVQRGKSTSRKKISSGNQSVKAERIEKSTIIQARDSTINIG